MYLGSETLALDQVRKEHQINTYLGAGATVNFVENVYLKTEGLFGLTSTVGKSDYLHTANQELIARSKYIDLVNGTTWLWSFGLGYKF